MTDDPGRFTFQLDPDAIEDNLRELGERVRRTVGTHRFSKVRISYKGKQLLPDIPLAVFIATEAASFWWVGPLRVLLLNLSVGSMLEVQLVNEANELVAEGRQQFMDGETERAEELYKQALRMRPGDPAALYNLAVMERVTGRLDDARKHLAEAAEGDDHPDAIKARELLAKLG